MKMKAVKLEYKNKMITFPGRVLTERWVEHVNNKL